MSLTILVINSGSSSVKFSLFDGSGPSPASLFEGEASGIGTPNPKLAFKDASGKSLLPEKPEAKPGITSPEDALEWIVGIVTGSGMPKVAAVGYRVVHPGALLHEHQRITPKVLADLRAAAEFAPLHDPAVLHIIDVLMAKFPGIGHFACFDTIFHQTMPPGATTYSIPKELRDKGVRRYGFHGLSCESIVVQMRAAQALPQRMAIAHLGGGCSVTAVLDGQSIDTSMGLTPTGGIVMATRPGDLDPGLVLYLLRQQPGDKDAAIGAVETMLNHHSGVDALSGISGDMREVEAAAGHDAQAALARTIFARTVKKFIGSYMALMGGLDAIVFAGGIGEHDAATRAAVLSGMASLGIALDEKTNSDKGSGLRHLNRKESVTQIFVVPAEEDRMIARHVARLAHL